MSRRLLLSLLLLLCAPVAPHSPHSPLAMAIQVKLDTLVAGTVRTAAYHDEHATVGLREPQFAAAGPRPPRRRGRGAGSWPWNRRPG